MCSLTDSVCKAPHNWTAADIAGANKECFSAGACARERATKVGLNARRSTWLTVPPAAFQDSDMKTILPGLILCGVMSIFAASFCLAQDADENEVIKGPQFGANFIVPKSSVSPDGR